MDRTLTRARLGWCPLLGDAQHEPVLVCSPSPTHRLVCFRLYEQLQVSVDDETGYTTSEDQGDREDAVLSTASTPPIPPAENQFAAKVSPVSAPTLTLDSAFAEKVGVDKGVQCDPEPTLMVSSASQCEGPARISISAGVQCSMPAPAPPVSSCGSQCGSDIETPASAGVQCSPLAEKDAEEKLRGAKFAPVVAGLGCAGSLAVLSKDVSEEACGLDSDGKAALPQPLRQSEQAQLIGVNERGTAPKNKKKRRKPKATGAAAPPTVEDATTRSSGASKTPRGELRDWAWGLTRRLFVCGIVGFVLAAVLGMTGRPGGSSWRASGVLARFGAHEGQEDRAQPPVWVTVGGSFTLGDVLASRRPVAEDDDAGEVQWFRDGRLLPGQIRWVECQNNDRVDIAGGGADRRLCSVVLKGRVSPNSHLLTSVRLGRATAIHRCEESTDFVSQALPGHKSSERLPRFHPCPIRVLLRRLQYISIVEVIFWKMLAPQHVIGAQPPQVFVYESAR